MADPEDTPTLPAIISRADAKAAGLTRYFDGKPCKRGHVAERLVDNYACYVCHAERSARYSASKHSRLYISTARAEAKAAGLTKYFDGRPCKHGHVTERLVCNHRCITCGILAGQRYRAANAEKVNAKARAKCAANREANSAKERNRHARKKAAGGFHTVEDIERIYQAQKGKCACCKAKVGKKYHVDHIVALSRGGSNFCTNLQILCAPCNVRKSNKDPVVFMREQGFLL